jgi:class 3 adenylate cyclase
MGGHTEGKVAAILAAVIVNDSRLAGTDEIDTGARLMALRRQFVEPLIGEYGGRVAELMGDSLLVEFASAVGALECAVAIQKGVAEPAADAIQYRIGINFGRGDVKGEGTLGADADDAARLAALAEPGGICIARPVYDEVKSELKLNYEHHSDWMNIALMSTKTPDSWPTTMDLIEVSAVKISAAAIHGQCNDAEPTGLAHLMARLVDRYLR